MNFNHSYCHFPVDFIISRAFQASSFSLMSSLGFFAFRSRFTQVEIGF